MKTAVVVVDLSYGDAGKGCVVDFLASKMKSWVVKCSGGHQCAHNVQAEGRNHCFSQIGAGSFSGAPTTLCGDFIFEPMSFRKERDNLSRMGIEAQVCISGACPVTTPYEIAVNRCREWARELSEGSERHGSCGKGIGETRVSWHSGIGLTVEDLHNWHGLVGKLRAIRSHCEARLITDGIPRHFWVERSIYDAAREMRWLNEDRLRAESFPEWNGTDETLIFEGSQGFYLDQHYGHHPHTTWGDVTSRNAHEIAVELGYEKIITLGVIRSYVTRHGSGPIKGLPFAAPHEKHNTHNEWQGTLRAARWTPEMLQNAMEVNKVDCLAINHLDVTDDVLEIVEALDVPVAIKGYGPDRGDKKLTEYGGIIFSSKLVAGNI